MHDHPMADGDAIADFHGLAGIGMDDTIVLDVGISPMVIHSLSPRITEPHHMLAFFFIRTLPITTALGAIQYRLPAAPGVWPSRE